MRVARVGRVAEITFFLGLLVKGQGIRNFVICLYQCGMAITHTVFQRKSSAF